MNDDMKDIAEIRAMMRAGNRFNVVLESLTDTQYLLIFKVVGGGDFILCTQKRRDRPLQAKMFTTSDAALAEIRRLKSDLAIGQMLFNVMISFKGR